jgi:signal peptidase II
MKIARYFIIAIIVILLDQASKLLVYNNMYLHEEIYVLGDWFRIHYLLNPGMAFGLRLESEFGKLALTLFRIAAMVGIAYYLWKMAKRNAHAGFLLSMSLILGGAVGNVIDSTFYGVLLNNAPADATTPWFHGQVIDMLYFPLFDFVWPEWVPMVGGRYFEFFSPVFNIADSSIFIGVVIILVMQRKFFKENVETPNTNQSSGERIVTENQVTNPTDSTDQQNFNNTL